MPVPAARGKDSPSFRLTIADAYAPTWPSDSRPYSPEKNVRLSASTE
jgi:hypothetical protein